MRNNRLNITYAGNDMVSIPHGFKESLRCTSVTGALKAIAKRNKENVTEAKYTDYKGETFTMVSDGSAKKTPKQSL